MLYTTEARDTVVIPVTSMLYEGRNVKVFVVEGDRAKERIVKVGNKYDDTMEIVEGLKGGETLVVVGPAEPRGRGEGPCGSLTPRSDGPLRRRCSSWPSSSWAS